MATRSRKVKNSGLFFIGQIKVKDIRTFIATVRFFYPSQSYKQNFKKSMKAFYFLNKTCLTTKMRTKKSFLSFENFVWKKCVSVQIS